MHAILLALATVAGSGADAAVPPNVPLWRDLVSGMTKAEVKARIPANRKLERTPGCLVEIWPRYVAGRLATVVVIDRTKSRACNDEAVAELMQFGPGDERIKKRTSGSGLMPVGIGFAVRNITWRGSPRSVHYTSSGQWGTFNVTYTVQPGYKFTL